MNPTETKFVRLLLIILLSLSFAIVLHAAAMLSFSFRTHLFVFPRDAVKRGAAIHFPAIWVAGQGHVSPRARLGVGVREALVPRSPLLPKNA